MDKSKVYIIIHLFYKLFMKWELLSLPNLCFYIQRFAENPKPPLGISAEIIFGLFPLNCKSGDSFLVKHFAQAIDLTLHHLAWTSHPAFSVITSMTSIRKVKPID